MLVLKEQSASSDHGGAENESAGAGKVPQGLPGEDDDADGLEALGLAPAKLPPAPEGADGAESKQVKGGGKSKGDKNDLKAQAAAPKAYYCKKEASNFSPEIQARGTREESRIKCAADDILCAINHIFEEEFDDKDRTSSQSAMLKTKSLCLSVWCEFLLTGEVSLNGKRIRAYSALRPEIQHMCRLAKEKLSIAGGAEQDPLAIARELTQELIDAPVHMLEEGEDDSHARVTQFMTSCGQQATKIQRFIEDVIDLPLSMHDVHIQTLRGCIGKTMELVDFLASIHKNVEATIPTRWLSFATDVSDFYAQNSGFVAGVDQAKLCKCFHRFGVFAVQSCVVVVVAGSW